MKVVNVKLNFITNIWRKKTILFFKKGFFSKKSKKSEFLWQWTFFRKFVDNHTNKFRNGNFSLLVSKRMILATLFEKKMHFV